MILVNFGIADDSRKFEVGGTYGKFRMNQSSNF